MIRQRIERQQITVLAETGDDAHGPLGQHRLPSKRLAGEDIRQVELDEGQTRGYEGIAQRGAGVREYGGIHEPTVRAVSPVFQPGDDDALVVGLYEIELDRAECGPIAQHLLDLGERVVSVVLGLSIAKPVQLGSVYDSDSHGGLVAFRACGIGQPVS